MQRHRLHAHKGEINESNSKNRLVSFFSRAKASTPGVKQIALFSTKRNSMQTGIPAKTFTVIAEKPCLRNLEYRLIAWLSVCRLCWLYNQLFKCLWHPTNFVYIKNQFISVLGCILTKNFVVCVFGCLKLRWQDIKKSIMRLIIWLMPNKLKCC